LFLIFIHDKIEVIIEKSDKSTVVISQKYNLYLFEDDKSKYVFLSDCTVNSININDYIDELGLIYKKGNKISLEKSFKVKLNIEALLELVNVS
jgi:hypothetical protein